MATTKYPYIQIAITVVDTAGLPADFSYNDAPMVTLPALSRISEMFVDLTDGYLMWETTGKRAYTYFRLASDVSTELSVTLMLDADILTPGRPIITLLSDVHRRISDGETIDSTLMERLIDEAGFAEQPLRASKANASWQQGDDICFRTYSSSGELNNIFGFPRQEAYIPYRGVLVVSAGVTVSPDATLPQISTPVDKALMVVCPPDVTASEYRVGFSDNLTITYYCEGFDPVNVMFEVGTTNRYVRINGPALVVNSAAHAGIIFHRRIPYTIEAVGGTPIDTYTILINGRTANRTEDSFEISNTDFSNGPVKITISSTNFTSFSQEFTPETLEAAAPLNVVLQPDSREVMLRLDFGSGRVVEKKISFEKNAPEYCQLRAGDFHGFRAHRLMGTDVETYNIDTKPSPAVLAPRESAQPVVAPAIAYARTERTASESQSTATPATTPQLPFDEPHTPVAPKIEKAPSAIWSPGKSKVVTPNFTNETTSGTDMPATDDGGTSVPLASRLRQYVTEKTIIVAVSLLLGIVAIVLLSTFLSGSEENPDTATADSITATTPDSLKTGTAQPTTQLSPDEQADIAYLNSNSKWRRTDLKSETYRSLIDAMASGDIDAVARHPYFSTKGQCSAKEAGAMVDYLWKAKGSYSEKSNVKALKEAAGADAIDLRRLNDNLARVRPQNPNTAPRP